MQSVLYAVILAGGGGTRFWPASRRALPKQFLSLGGHAPLLAATRARLGDRFPDERVLVVAGESQAALVRDTLPSLPAENLLLEPVGRNTLPAIALAAAELGRRDEEAVQVVLPADHIIAPEDTFRASLEAAAAVAAQGRLVTFGIEPTFPATGYGYIERGAALLAHDQFPAFEVDAFHEKPDQARAEEYLAAGGFLWNSGMFVWSTAAIIQALEQHAPETWSALASATGSALAAAYEGVPSQPVDIGVMERAEARAVIPVGYSWSDVGTWEAVADVAPMVGDNVLIGGGELHTLDARGNVVWADPSTLTALIGVEDLVVVRAGDAVLVCPKSRSEQVKRLVEDLPEAHR
jgi:mannose-1-phosphate guanylyltransferase/mannose-6-phosphate isomerase